MEQNIPYLMFENCIPVKGVQRSLICDLQRNKFHLIPNSLFDLLSQTKGKTIAEVKSNFEPQFTDVIQEYFDFLESEELIFFTDSPLDFPKMSLAWHHPSTIVNSIIDVNASSDIASIKSFIKQLDSLDCKNIEIRSFNLLPLNTLQEIIDATNFSTIISIGIILSNDKYDELILSKFCDQNKRVTSLTVFGCTHDTMYHSERYATPIRMIEKVITNEKCCGIIKPEYFTSYIETFTESLAHNSCLNRKISIDVQGNIKNCPSMQTQFGNIKNTQIKDALDNPDFKKYWDINKDQISKCKECEFRHICTDCRGYLDNPEDIYSAPLKCGYDPHTCEWEDWSINPLKAEAINYYNLHEILPSF